MIFYKSYKYSPKATLVSLFGSLGALIFVCIGAAMVFGSGGNIPVIVGGVPVIALGVFLFVYVSRKLPDKIAAEDGPKNIRTKAGFALTFVREHPEQYDYIRSINPDFAAKYTRNEQGKVVRIR